MICKHCNKEFEQNPSSKTRDTKFCSSQCRSKNWVINNREKHNEQVRGYRAKRCIEEGEWRETSPKALANKLWMNEIKSKPCSDCGNTFEVCCMDFDHKPEYEKKYCLGTMFAHHYSRELIETELEKCELVCSNCHRIRTKNRRLGSGKYQK